MKIYPSHEQPYIYTVNDQDLIIQVNSQPWNKFYKRNAYTFESCFSHSIVGHSIWDYIDNDEIRQLYKLILENVRKYQKQLQIPFRCDSSAMNSYLKLIISPLKENHIQFISEVICIEYHKEIALWDTKIPRCDKKVSVCSICRLIKNESDKWIDAHIYMEDMKLVNEQIMPNIFHDLCPHCVDTVVQEIEKLKL